MKKGIFSSEACPEDRLVTDFDKLKQMIGNLKGLGNRIILTQGVFDLLHIGHIKYLEEAKNLGDILIVGVDSDEMTRQRKGPTRPIVPEDERIAMLIHLRHVDIVTLRQLHQDTNDLIRVVEPDVLIVSETTADFQTKHDALREWCKEIKCLPPQATTSTTNRIRKLTMDGGYELAQKIKKLITEHTEEREG